MALATRTVSINPAFLQEIKDDHHELRQLMHHTSAMLARPTWMRVEYERLVELFSKLRDQLAMHFSLEEAYGYFEDAITVAPHLSRKAEKLRLEHRDLYAALCTLEDHAEKLLYHESPHILIGRLSEGYREFAARFLEHETNENELILAAFDDDLGGGD